MLSPEETNEFTKRLVDEGRLIEAGWQGLAKLAYSDGVGAEQLDQLRNAFFSGAQHLFACIMNVLDPESEPTDADIQRMNNIHNELSRFLDEFRRKYLTEH